MFAKCLFSVVALLCFVNVTSAQMMYTETQAADMIDAEQQAWIGACDAQTRATGAAGNASDDYAAACDYYTSIYIPLYGADANIEALLQTALNEGNAGDVELSNAQLSMSCGDTNATAADNAFTAGNYDSAWSFANAGYDNYMAAMEYFSNATDAYNASIIASQDAMSMMSP